MKNKIHLGLVCLTSIACPVQISYRKVLRSTIARDDFPARLTEVYAHNVATLRTALTFCRDVLKTRLYRMSSGLFPWLDWSLTRDSPSHERYAIQGAFADMSKALAQIGKDFGLDDPDHGMRLTSHPDQFCVLSSDRPEVVDRSIAMLQAEAMTMDALGCPRSAWSAINIHGGKADRRDQLRQVLGEISTSSPSVHTRLTLENDERAYNWDELLGLGVPVVYDAHHHLVHDRLPGYDDLKIAEALRACRKTWDKPDHQLCHISNGRLHLHDRTHSDLISHWPEAFSTVGEIWIDVEAKAKEQAVEGLRWRYLTSST